VIDLTASTAHPATQLHHKIRLRPAQVTSYTSRYNFSLPPTLNALSWFYKTHCNHKIRPIMVVRNPFCSTVGRAASQLTSHPARQANTLRLRRRSLCAISSSTPTHNLSANLPPSLRLPGRREAVNRLNVWHPSHPSIPLDPLSYFFPTRLYEGERLRLTYPTSWDRSPSIRSESVTESPELKKWIDNYLWVGEWAMDQSVAIMASTSFFERKR
jgi:hypothetical protein